MDNQYWNYIVTFVGLIGFYLGGKKIWWAWYVNIANQFLWLTFGLVTQQWGFVVGTFFYTPVFVRNAYLWTKEHQQKQDLIEKIKKGGPTIVLPESEPKPTISFHFDGRQFQEGTIITQHALKDLKDKFTYGPKRWRWLPLWLRKRIFTLPLNKGRAGPKIGEVKHMELRDNGLFVTSTIDRTTAEGLSAWMKINAPGPVSITDQRREEALVGYGLSSIPCQGFTLFQGREIKCEIDEHPHGLDHQAILDDMMPKMLLQWDGDAQNIMTIEELDDLG